jgi:predicted nucleic acid-binding protein
MDTNILVFAAEAKPNDARKSAIARELVLGQVFGVSAQSIAEFVNVATGIRKPLPAPEVERWIAFLSAMPFTVVDADIVRRGHWLCRRYRIQYYDAALLAAAERLGAPVFYSEDLSHGQAYGDVRVIDPFR